MNILDKKEAYCMSFTKEEIKDFFITPLSQYPEVDIRILSSDYREISQNSNEAMRYISFDGENCEFYIRLLGCETALFILNEEFMFIDDDVKEKYRSSDTFHNVVYEGSLNSKDHKEILDLIRDIVIILIGAQRIHVKQTVVSEEGISYPKCEYAIDVFNNSEIKRRTKIENILFAINPT